MAENQELFSEGDWVFHLYHGVGQVKGIEEKTLGGETKKYYKVEASKGTFWIAMSKMESDRIRLVADEEMLQKALGTLKTAPQTMSEKHTTRKARITQVAKEGDLISFCTLLRDLQARRVADKLNTTEQRAHRRLKKRITSEWAASSGEPINIVTKELNKIIRNIPVPEK